jgi:hypothetical protein
MYKIIKSVPLGNIIGVKKYENNTVLSIPFDPDNTDYQAYLKWLDEGNEPLPADE